MTVGQTVARARADAGHDRRAGGRQHPHPRDAGQGHRERRLPRSAAATSTPAATSRASRPSSASTPPSCCAQFDAQRGRLARRGPGRGADRPAHPRRWRPAAAGASGRWPARWARRSPAAAAPTGRPSWPSRSSSSSVVGVVSFFTNRPSGSPVAGSTRRRARSAQPRPPLRRPEPTTTDQADPRHHADRRRRGRRPTASACGSPSPGARRGCASPAAPTARRRSTRARSTRGETKTFSDKTKVSLRHRQRRRGRRSRSTAATSAPRWLRPGRQDRASAPATPRPRPADPRRVVRRRTCGAVRPARSRAVGSPP